MSETSDFLLFGHPGHVTGGRQIELKAGVGQLLSDPLFTFRFGLRGGLRVVALLNLGEGDTTLTIFKPYSNLT